MENRFPGALDFQFLRDTLPVLVEEVALGARQHTRFLHEGGKCVSGKWISGCGKIAWPRR